MRRIISIIITLIVSIEPLSVIPAYANEQVVNDNNYSEHRTPAYQNTPRRMENLSRGLYAVKVDSGVYLSWRLLGTEDLESQTYDIYRNGELIKTTDVDDPTCYIDGGGSVNDKYKVVRKGESADEEKEIPVINTNITGSYKDVNNSAAYFDIPVEKPEDGILDVDQSVYTYTVGDISVADLDGDSEYEFIVKWDPSDQKDNGTHGYTGKVLIDAYEQDGTKLWRIDMGKNIRAGAHYTQIIAYDFDGDSKAEVAIKTAPGTIDGTGQYVTEAGNTDDVINADNDADYRTKEDSSSPLRRKGHIIEGPEYLTMFNGETGEALRTIPYEPERGEPELWGDGYGNRCNRYLAGVAYLDGINPSLIMCRGYYARSAVVAYDWNGTEFVKKWILDSSVSGNEDFAGQGAHSLIVSDIDKDEKDEIVYGSAIVDDDGSLYSSTGHGHGDVLHVSDFDNDGRQEVFQSHEDWQNFSDYAVEYRKADTGETLVTQSINEDVAKGVIGNFDDSYALEHPDSKSIFWTSSFAQFYDINGNLISEDTSPSNRRFHRFCIYWDGDLGREVIDGSMMAKPDVDGDEKFIRFFFGRTGSFPDCSPTTGSYVPLVADISGDWREECIFSTNNSNALRVYMSTIPTNYKLTTLMHDSQYRTCIASQNVAYNQVPHTSYYIGSLALAEDENGNKLNYLAPNVPFTNVEKMGDYKVKITDIDTSGKQITVNNRGNEINADVIIALYDENENLLELTDKQVSLSEGINTVEYESNDEAKKIRCFIWNGIESLQPVSEKYEINTK